MNPPFYFQIGYEAFVLGCFVQLLKSEENFSSARGQGVIWVLLLWTRIFSLHIIVFFGYRFTKLHLKQFSQNLSHKITENSSAAVTDVIRNNRYSLKQNNNFLNMRPTPYLLLKWPTFSSSFTSRLILSHIPKIQNETLESPFFVNLLFLIWYCVNF